MQKKNIPDEEYRQKQLQRLLAERSAYNESKKREYQLAKYGLA